MNEDILNKRDETSEFMTSVEFSNRAKKIKMLMLDVDGVLTGGQIILDNQGNETKIFNVRDGHGIKMIQRTGIIVALLTGRSSKVVNLRAAELGIEEVCQGALSKLPKYLEMIEKLGISDDEVAYVGDDIVDIPVMKKVGLAFSVADAESYVKAVAHVVSTRKGGEAAVREIIDMILVARGDWDNITAKYFC